MYCINCGKELDNDAVFCDECGFPVELDEEMVSDSLQRDEAGTEVLDDAEAFDFRVEDSADAAYDDTVFAAGDEDGFEFSGLEKDRYIIQVSFRHKRILHHRRDTFRSMCCLIEREFLKLEDAIRCQEVSRIKEIGDDFSLCRFPAFSVIYRASGLDPVRIIRRTDKASVHMVLVI